MAEEIQIAGTEAKAKIRSPWAAALLPIVTIGIYYFVWYYKINREMADLGRARGKTDELGDNPGKSLLAITLGALIIVPAVLSTIHTAQRIQRAQKLSGIEPQLNGWLALVLYLLIAPGFWAYEQSELNKVWRSGGQPAAITGSDGAAAAVTDPAGTEPAGTPPVEPTQGN